MMQMFESKCKAAKIYHLTNLKIVFPKIVLLNSFQRAAELACDILGPYHELFI